MACGLSAGIASSAIFHNGLAVAAGTIAGMGVGVLVTELLYPVVSSCLNHRISNIECR